MPVGQLLKWDLTIINQSLLTPASYKQMETSFVLADGKDSHYGLGVDILEFNGHKVIEHSGEVGGFVAENILFPDDHVAIAVLTNQEASGAAADISKQIAPLILPSTPAPAAAGAADPPLPPPVPSLPTSRPSLPDSRKASSTALSSPPTATTTLTPTPSPTTSPASPPSAP